MALGTLISAGLAFAQSGDWMNGGFDAQRSNWVRNDSKISVESLRKPGFAVVWKLKIEGTPTTPALMDFYIGYRGFRTLGFFGAASNRVIAVDTDLGRKEWEKNWPSNAGPAAPGCPGGMTSGVARPTAAAYPPLNPRGSGRGTPAKSGVGEPYKGAVTLRVEAAPRPPAPAVPIHRKPPASAPEVNPYAPRVQYLMALAADGKLHSMWVSNGNEATPPLPFLPPNAKASGLLVFDNTAYVTTISGCGGVDNGVWALDLTTKQVTHWKTAATGIAGSAGPVAGPDGRIYVAAARELIALSPKKLETVGTYKTDGAEFTSSPVVFDFKGRSLLVVAASDGRLHLLDTAALGSVLDISGAFGGQDFHPGGLASWHDRSGNRWILSSVSAGGNAQGFQTNGEVKNGAIAAWKLVEKEGAVKLEAGWMSRDLVSPNPPIIVNDVVFALSGGVPHSGNAVLYALDSATGRELWNSGAAMESNSITGAAAGGARVYASTQDGTQYAFGFPAEH